MKFLFQRTLDKGNDPCLRGTLVDIFLHIIFIVVGLSSRWKFASKYIEHECNKVANVIVCKMFVRLFLQNWSSDHLLANSERKVHVHP